MNLGKDPSAVKNYIKLIKIKLQNSNLHKCSLKYMLKVLLHIIKYNNKWLAKWVQAFKNGRMSTASMHQSTLCSFSIVR